MFFEKVCKDLSRARFIGILVPVATAPRDVDRTEQFGQRLLAIKTS